MTIKHHKRLITKDFNTELSPFLKVSPCVDSIFAQSPFFMNYFMASWRQSTCKCKICFLLKGDLRPQVIFLLCLCNALLMLSLGWEWPNPKNVTVVDHIQLEAVVKLTQTFEWGLLDDHFRAVCQCCLCTLLIFSNHNLSFHTPLNFSLAYT